LVLSINHIFLKKWLTSYESFKKRTHQKKHQKKAKDGCHG